LTESKWTAFSKILVGLLCFPLSLAVWAFYVEPRSFSNHRSELTIPDWPAECDGFRVAVLADLHVGSPFNGLDKLRDIVELTLEREPDLVLLAGDYVIHGVLGGQFVSPEDAAVELAALAAPAGVFAVLGNHDWWFDAQRVTRALESVQIPVLEDRSLSIRHGRCEFSLVGVGDFWEGAHDVEAALADVPDGASTLLFTHNPDLFPRVPEGVTLTIAGHTHGGQVYLPGIGRPIVPSQFGERFAIGHIVEKDRHLFVSPGLGTSILPVRFLVPPEITILDLRAGLDPIPTSVGG